MCVHTCILQAIHVNVHVIKVELEYSMLCMLYIPNVLVEPSHCLGVNSIHRILTSILHSLPQEIQWLSGKSV